MKSEFEPREIQLIAEKVVEFLKPMLSNNSKHNGDDPIFDVKDLSEYLRVKKQWVYEKIHQNSIPFYKVGKYPRFRKSKVDEWLEKIGNEKIKKLTNTTKNYPNLQA
ncbi:MAG: helix-turn-helix domain-containing protein [Candidatus Jettenia sp.]|nr:MAG: helix-turn-helix domain-containing protein [Candidatus Jettenia sp.]